MSLQRQQAESSPTVDSSSSATTSSSTGAAPTVDTPATETRGGGTYVIKRGDTLSSIAQNVYGNARYWRDIMTANPTKVARGGDLILTGDELVLPVLEVPAVAGPTPTPTPGPTPTPTPAPTPAPTPTPTPTPDPGPPPVAPAIEPTRRTTDFGDFLVYPDDYVGPLPATGPDHLEHVYARDVDNLIASRRAQAEADREAAVEDINDRLSYGVFDWAITDDDATVSLQRLGNLHFTQIGPAISQIGQDKVNRLLDNLPASEFRTPAFAKVVVALGPAGAAPYLQNLLSYGVFDWAVTDGDVDAVLRVVNAAPAEQRASFILGLDQKFQVRFAENLHQGAAITPELLKTLFDAMPDSETDALKNLLGVRFGFSVGTRKDGEWTAAALRQAWTIIEQLPPGHVIGNDELDTLMAVGKTDGSGYYSSDGSVNIEYGDLAKNGSYGAIMVDDGTGNRVDVGLHSNVNLFNTVVRHEIGHAVDAKIGASGPGGYARTAANAGRWATYDSADAFAQAIIDAGGGMSGHGYPDEAVYEQALRKAVSDGTDFNTALSSLQGGFLGTGIGAVGEGVAPAAANVTGPVAAVFNLDRWHESKNPWYSANDRSTVGGRVFQMAYSGSTYCSYDWTARQTYGVSAYQYRAPGEWFAEAYACYYSDHDSVTGSPVGTRLRTRDAATADWFDANVDQGYSLQSQAPSTGGGPASPAPNQSAVPSPNRPTG